MMKGYTGEGFLSEGQRLGGRGSIPMHEARRLASTAAEKRRTLTAGSGQRLGGRALRPGEDIRRVIVSAVERRNETLKGCGQNNHSEKEIQEIAETATRNGFSTQAEEDAANEAAIAHALWELVQEDEKSKYGSSYRAATASNPAGSSRSTQDRKPTPLSDTAKEPSALHRLAQQPSKTPSHDTMGRPESSAPTSWTCEICTLQNPVNHLCCDACGTEMTEEVARELEQRSAKRQRTAVVDLTESPAKDYRTALPAARPNTDSAAASQTSGSHGPKRTWSCSFCGRVRDWNLWSCDLCGKIKESS